MRTEFLRDSGHWTFGRLSLYVELRDLWVGAYIAHDAIYVCLLPTMVIRWRRRLSPTAALLQLGTDLADAYAAGIARPPMTADQLAAFRAKMDRAWRPPILDWLTANDDDDTQPHCPACRSTDVHGVGNMAITQSDPDGTLHETAAAYWQCDDCGTRFETGAETVTPPTGQPALDLGHVGQPRTTTPPEETL